MKPETKLLIRKRVLMTLRAILWHADEWLHRQEVKYRNDLPVSVPVEPPKSARAQAATVSCPYPFPEDELVRNRIRGRIPRDRQPQRSTQTKRRGMSSAEFDLRFAR